MNANRFRLRQIRSLGTAAKLFTAEQLDEFRDEELEILWAERVRKTNVTDCTLTVGTGVWYALPSAIKKVRRIEFWDKNPETDISAIQQGTASLWTDAERAGFVRINEAPTVASGQLIYLIGEGPYLTIDELPGEAIGAVLYGSLMHSIEANLMSRAAVKNAPSVSRRYDVTLSSLSQLLARFQGLYAKALSRAHDRVKVV